MTPAPHLCQVALSVANVAASLRFYTTVFDYKQAGGGRLIGGQMLERIQGLPDPHCICWWLINDQPFFQLELFQYASPGPAPRPAGWTPDAIGYGRLGFTVPDLDLALAAAAHVGAPLLSEPKLSEGRRSATVADPDGTWVDLVEDRAATGCRLVQVGASTPSAANSRTFVTDVLGYRSEAPAGALSFKAEGRDTSLAFTEQAGARRSGWRINDVGILNIALGYREWPEFKATYDRVVAAGHRAETVPMGPSGPYDVSYVMDSDGFSVELLYCPESSDIAIGFAVA
ncbi:MAG: VOC family protein [Dehalococcoidia bacterium]